jgi:sigma-B regulation protein RsbU (phosphoserine phosphatase)
MPSLEIIAGSRAGEVFEIVGEQTLIGRSPVCDVVLPLHTVSRRQARIAASEGGYVIEDLGSLNGTFVNGRRLDGPRPLKDKDVIQLYDVVMVFHAGAPPLRARAAFLADEDENGKRETMPKLPLHILADDTTKPPAAREIVHPSSISSESHVHVSPDVKLRAVLEITRSLGSSLDLDDVLPKILDNLFNVFPQSDRGYILLRDDATGELTPRAWKRRDQTATFGPISRTIAERVMSHREAILSSDVEGDERLSDAESVLEMQIRSMMCAPLMGPSQEPQGILHIETNDPVQRFERDDLDVLVTIATVAGQAVENARAHQARLLLDRREREMATARDMQLQFLPQRRPQVRGYEFYDYYQPAAEVGGDYFGYIPLPDGRLAVALGDVSGKGVPAALLMARLSAETRACVTDASTPAAAVARLHHELVGPTFGGRFITFVLCVLDPKTHEITLVNAGHPDPLLRRASGEVIPLGAEEKGLPLGFMLEDEPYREAKYRLEPGDLVLAYTDGISDAHNAQQQIYGTARVVQVVSNGPGAVEPLCEALLQDVEGFMQDWRQSDDMCLVCFGRTGGE